MALADWCFISVSELADYMGVAIVAPADVAMAELIIEGVTGHLEGETARKLKSRTYSPATDEGNTIYDGDGSTMLFTRQYPLTALAKIIVDSTTVSDGADTLHWYKSGRVVYESGFTKDYRNVQVYYTAGYVEGTSEYAELKMLSLMLCAAVYQMYTAAPGLGLYDSGKIGQYQYKIGAVFGWLGMVLEGSSAEGLQTMAAIKKYRRKLGM